MDRDYILNEIKRTTKQNGSPLGRDRFAKETGINEYRWGKFWARFSDAQKEAGVGNNLFQQSYSENFLLEKSVNLIKKLQKFPTYNEMQVERNSDKEFPDKGAFQRLGTKKQLLEKVIGYCENNNEEDVIRICKTTLSVTKDTDVQEKYYQVIGEVYLFKSGKYYKIGKSFDLVRRGKEIKIQLPEKLYLVHSIKTDDPSGVENYWHKRFEQKRLNGEWFNLGSNEVKAFKLWKKII